MEIERKFLLASLPEGLESYPHVEIEQGYLASRPTIRIRKMGNRHILTIKEHITNQGAIVNREEEFDMDPSTYASLLPKCEGRVVSKTRYRIPISDSLTAELDIFSGRHQGLQLVEVEFPDIESAKTFVAPSWFGQDVSDDKHYRNAYLSSH